MKNKKQDINELPIELIKNILSYLSTKDLINVSNVNKKFRKIISNEIEIYYNIENNKYKHFLHKPLNYLEDNIYIHDKLFDYTGVFYENDRDSEFEMIKNLYNKHYIYKIIIDNNLFCQICKYKLDFNNNNINTYISRCKNCYENFCNSCIKECNECDPDEYLSYHCFNCKDKCFKNLENKLNDINITNEELKNIKKIIFESYIEAADPDSGQKIYNHYYIDNTEYTDIIKNFLKNNSSDLEFIVNNN